MQDLNISLIQADLRWEDREANLSMFDQWLLQVPAGTQLIILPEMFSTGFSMHTDRCAEAPGGSALQWMLQHAKNRQAAIAGSVMVNDDGRMVNRLYWVQANGQVQYADKKHLFRFGHEDDHFHPGDRRVIVEVMGWKFCPLICYDLRFPVWSRNTYRDGQFGYDVLLYVANWPDRRAHHWQSLLVARAIENMAFSVGVNRVGEDGAGLRYAGHSMVTDPLGQVTTGLQAGESGIISSTLSAATLLDWRTKFGAGPDWDRFEIITG